MENIAEVGHNGGWDGLVSGIVFLDFIGAPHGDTLLAGFVRLQRAEARLITKYIYYRI